MRVPVTIACFVFPVITGAQRAPADTAPVLAVQSAFVGLSVSDMDASERWYREKLGLKVASRAARSDANKSAMVLLQGGGLTVELVRHDDAVPLGTLRTGPGGALFVHGIFKVGVFVTNYDDVLAKLRARNVPIVIGPFPDRPDQPANFMIRDNAENYIQVLRAR